MTCPNNHPESEIREQDGRRICSACKRKYSGLNGRRKQMAIQESRTKTTNTEAMTNSRNGRRRKQGARNNQSAQHRINRVRVTSLTREPSKEKNNEHRDHQH